MLEAAMGANALALLGVVVLLFRLDRRLDALEQRSEVGTEMIRRLATATRRLWEKQKSMMHRITTKHAGATDE